MTNHQKAINLIHEISMSNTIIKEIFLKGSCCNLYFILKSVFPEAKAYFNVDHIITKIDKKYYDITGEISLKEVTKKGYKPINKIYPNKYNTDESIKQSEMYLLKNKPIYTST